MKWANQLSVIVPVGPNEKGWGVLLEQLKPLSEEAEILLSACDPIELPQDFHNRANIKVVLGSKGRGVQLNRAVALASRKYLWFIHCDSQLTLSTFPAIKRAMSLKTQAVWFFDLGFYDGPSLLWVNALGTKLRSRLLRLPFGDQGFVMTQETFKKLNGFEEKAPYGEDHLLVWKAHEKHIPVKPIQGKLLTSGRKYQRFGWWKTTCQHLRLTYEQAKTECLRIREKKLRVRE
jgi:hypothetical protein